MFTIQQIEAAHARIRTGADFLQYAQDLKAMGIAAFDTYVTDSHSRYYGAGNFSLTSDAKYAALNIAPKSDVAALEQALKIHQQGNTDYLTFCRQAADAGVEKWRMDMIEMTCTYYSAEGNAMVRETIPDAESA